MLSLPRDSGLLPLSARRGFHRGSYGLRHEPCPLLRLLHHPEVPRTLYVLDARHRLDPGRRGHDPGHLRRRYRVGISPDEVHRVPPAPGASSICVLRALALTREAPERGVPPGLEHGALPQVAYGEVQYHPAAVKPAYFGHEVQLVLEARVLRGARCGRLERWAKDFCEALAADLGGQRRRIVGEEPWHDGAPPREQQLLRELQIDAVVVHAAVGEDHVLRPHWQQRFGWAIEARKELRHHRVTHVVRDERHRPRDAQGTVEPDGHVRGVVDAVAVALCGLGGEAKADVVVQDDTRDIAHPRQEPVQGAVGVLVRGRREAWEVVGRVCYLRDEKRVKSCAWDGWEHGIVTSFNAPCTMA
mmetsp:Transcript_40876/g.128077  ORF Transcript_40876/g.128077 Transcript_40876/m.128077 type:complete len:359 (+) Transcript_40876:3614-4690(+)